MSGLATETAAKQGRMEALFAELGETLPGDVLEAVHRQWRAIRSWWPLAGHAAPTPIWARRPFDHDGNAAWHCLGEQVLAEPRTGAMSAYVHVPFCERRCGFCDLYSLPRPREWAETEERFARALEEEMERWSAQPGLQGRPVTTVHFGGGTPNLLRAPVLRRIVSMLAVALGSGRETEWALESTSRRLSDEHLAELRDMGFTRLHVGVQSLHDPLRRLIGRKEPADVVTHKLGRAQEAGLVVSADVLYGLPGQRVQDLVATLERLVALDLDGFSLYQLQRTERNRRFLDNQGAAAADPLANYLMFQIGEHWLRRAGYRKIFFTHFARPRDRNLYYSHVTRNEDLLALGPTADGIFGDYVYRHPELGDYLARRQPALEGGMRESPWERRIRPAVAAVMNAAVPAGMLASIGAGHLRDLWLACDALQPNPDRGVDELTANGSWIIAAMINQLHRLGAS